jgi:hypothetical protein
LVSGVAIIGVMDGHPEQENAIPGQIVQILQAPYQVLKFETVVAEVYGGGTSAVVLRGAEGDLPEGAVLVAPGGSSTAAGL